MGFGYLYNVKLYFESLVVYSIFKEIKVIQDFHGPEKEISHSKKFL